jgi:2-C-methyl-D-erythritol 4-phosphate cytidylyltransferase / 2-C-methyl-D-erythritol 2,4-cyclodiphosphate synthase
VRTTAIIVAAGKGERAGSDIPKQFRHIAGKTVIRHALDRLRAHPRIDHTIIIIAPGQQDQLAAALGPSAPDMVIEGGVERQNSVHNGLKAAQSLGAECVLIHDAARPFVPHIVIDALLDALQVHDGAIPALPVVDTLTRAEMTGALGETVARDGLFKVQTPQAFSLSTIMTSHSAWTGGAATDDAQMARNAGFSVAIIPGDPMLEKLTVCEDFDRMEAQLAQAMICRTAMGYDVHRLAEGEELWLGGILVPHDKGLSGHSDADVVLHALTDALLGTIAAGDIGAHFPPSDPKWRGARSSQFVQHAQRLIIARGGIIDHVDLTIICEAPKIGPHREAMRSAIAEMLNISPDSISVKATTTEGLGFTGRGEGIAAQAVASVRLPNVRIPIAAPEQPA